MKNKINKKRIIILSVLALLLAMITTGVVYGATWEYSYTLSVHDSSGATRYYVPVMLNFNPNNLVTSGKIDADGLDTEFVSAGLHIPYMLATNNATALIPVLVANGVAETILYTGYTPAQDSFDIILLGGGYFTVLDNDTLEITNKYTMEFTSLYIDTTAGSGKYILYKDGACNLRVSDTVSGNIIFQVTGGNTLTATGIPSGYLESIIVSANTTHVSLSVNGIVKDSALISANIPNTANNWILCSGNTTLSIGSFTLER
jgi:hypothetical protein